jgi:regulator of RNase E activity RraA
MLVSQRYPMIGLSKETLANLQAASTATLTTQLFRRGIRNAFIQGVQPLGPSRNKLIGPAFTLRYIPAREDIDAFGAKPDPNDLQREALEAVPPGHVLVMDCRGETRAASAGDIYVARLAVKGVAGVVSDGAVRDSEQIRRMSFSVFCAGPSAPTNRIVHHAADYGLPIGCGGVAVYPGDIVVGDSDGVAVIPRRLVDEVAADAAEQELLESYILRRVTMGASLPGLYPINQATRAAYEAWCAEQARVESANETSPASDF